VISTGDSVCICAITAFVLVIFRIAANSELRPKSLGLGLGLEMQGLDLGLGLDKKVLFTRLVWDAYSEPRAEPAAYRNYL